MPAIRNYIVEITTQQVVRGAVSPAAAIQAALGNDNAQEGLQPRVESARVIKVTGEED